MIRIFYLVLILLAWLPPAKAQTLPYQPLRINTPVILDGKLTEAEWHVAMRIDDFMQAYPVSGAEPSERTEVSMMYDDTYLYVGYRCFDPEPDKLIMLNMGRDFTTSQEDGVAFVIDTYNDKSSGLVFITNLLGARWDEEFTGDGGNENPSYNTYWDTESFVDSLGYTTELRIPFSSLRYETRNGIVTMGFKYVRLIKRRNEYMIYPKCDPKIDNPYFKASLAREMEFQDLKSNKPFYFTPYIIANYFESSSLNASGTSYDKTSEFMTRKNYFENDAIDKVVSNIGADIKYGLTKNFTLDFSINTDFAQAEVDNVIINLSKYEVNLPEKRSFFLESKNYLSFSTSNGSQLFRSRSIGNENDLLVPIIAGARVTGKSNGWQMGILDMQTRGISSDSIDPKNYFVFRTRKDIDSTGSFVGGIITNRSSTNENKLSNQSIGIDIVKKLNAHVVLVGAISSTFVDGEVTPFAKSTYYNAAVFRSAKTGITYNANLDFVGSSFDPVMGYNDEQDYGATSAGIGYKIAGRENGNIAYIFVNNGNTYRWKQSSGKMETFYTDFKPGIDFKSGAEIIIGVAEYRLDSLFSDWELNSSNQIAAGFYEMFTNSIYLLAPQKSVYSTSVRSSYGGFYGGKRFYISPEFSIALGRHFNTGITYEYNNIRFDKFLNEDRNTIFETNLIRVNLTYQMSTKFSVKLFTQYDDLNDKLSGNLRFRYNPREGTDLFIVFNQGNNTNRKRLEPNLPAVEQQAVTVKFLRTFAL